jgi:hypothetical protein
MAWDFRITEIPYCISDASMAPPPSPMSLEAPNHFLKCHLNNSNPVDRNVGRAAAAGRKSLNGDS